MHSTGPLPAITIGLNFCETVGSIVFKFQSMCQSTHSSPFASRMSLREPCDCSHSSTSTWGARAENHVSKMAEISNTTDYLFLLGPGKS